MTDYNAPILAGGRGPVKVHWRLSTQPALKPPVVLLLNREATVVRSCLTLLLLLAAGPLGAQTPDKAVPPISRKLPPPGISVPAEDRARLETAVSRLTRRVQTARGKLELPARERLPDVEIYLKAVQVALANDEFFDPKDVARADDLLRRGQARLDELTAGKPSWLGKHGTLALGFRSRLDDSVQPYGLVIPEGLDLTSPARSKPVPLYVWLHGRGDKATELSFILSREGKPGDFHPADAIVLHPFGRYCNGFKFAGEVDVFEAIEAVRSRYAIDAGRIVLCGFSMGGAGAWHLGAHFPDAWVAVTPGAGFAETAQYQHLKPENYPAWYEQKLWGWYDVPDYVLNLFNLPVIAYSGELDKQIQAARIMEAAFRREGHTLEHLIGPGVAHKYQPDTLKELQRRLAQVVARGRPEHPDNVTLETRTLRYPRSGPLEMLGLGEHWQDARAQLDWSRKQLRTVNVSALRLSLSASGSDRRKLQVDEQWLELPDAREAILVRKQQHWQLTDRYPADNALRKIHGLQGPIDDAFLRPFLVVMPSGQAASPKVQRWVKFEMEHFLDRWRRLFRGEPHSKVDTAVDDSDMRRYNLIVWGDPASNRLLARLAERLPLVWSQDEVKLGAEAFAAAHHVPVMVYPNPFAPDHYVVINSGITFREGHDTSNSLQTPKLPDWAVVDLDTPPDAYRPGKIAAAGFFDEQWHYRRP
ncbi:MAG TPA: prolyl oligopeptidase family serine peptidase [Pirellulales bacterium]|jgi:dienelactone hydrolase|nr:prolyl oligopeptidase family serine peptidase [Pirellulales bacterium]